MTPNVIVFALVQLALLPLMIRYLRLVGLVAWIMVTAVFGAAMFAPTWLHQVLNDVGFARFFNS
jgi:hypothetical protein